MTAASLRRTAISGPDELVRRDATAAKVAVLTGVIFIIADGRAVNEPRTFGVELSWKY